MIDQDKTSRRNSLLLYRKGYKDRWKGIEAQEQTDSYLRGYNDADRDSEDLNPQNYPNDSYSV